MPRAHARHRVRACSLVLVAVLSAIATGVRGAAPATIVSHVPQWPANPDWQRFVKAPTAPMSTQCASSARSAQSVGPRRWSDRASGESH